MDERLEKALEFANYRQTLANQKKNIKERMDILQSVHYGGGSFKANQETIAFISTLVNMKKETAILVDTKDKAVEITDLEDFLETLVSAYIASTTEYKTQMDKVSKMRSIKKIMDW